MGRRRHEVGMMMMMMIKVMTIKTMIMLLQLDALVEGAAGKSYGCKTLHRWVLAE